MHFRYFLAVFELLSDSLTAIYVELHRCPLHHSILLTQGRIWEIFAKKFWELAILKNELFLSRPFWIFFSKFFFFFCFIPMKISPNLYGRMDGSKFWCFPWLKWGWLIYFMSVIWFMLPLWQTMALLRLDWSGSIVLWVLHPCQSSWKEKHEIWVQLHVHCIQVKVS